MSKSNSKSSLAQPALWDVPQRPHPDAARTGQDETFIEFAIRCKDEGTHPTPPPGELFCEDWSKRNACSNRGYSTGAGSPAFSEEAPRKHADVVS